MVLYCAEALWRALSRDLRQQLVTFSRCGVVSKTLSDEQMDDLANALSSYTPGRLYPGSPIQYACCDSV